jgi:hypothetical protein
MMLGVVVAVAVALLFIVVMSTRRGFLMGVGAGSPREIGLSTGISSALQTPPGAPRRHRVHPLASS